VQRADSQSTEPHLLQPEHSFEANDLADIGLAVRARDEDNRQEIQRTAFGRYRPSTGVCFALIAAGGNARALAPKPVFAGILAIVWTASAQARAGARRGPARDARRSPNLRKSMQTPDLGPGAGCWSTRHDKRSALPYGELYLLRGDAPRNRC
jgi:hypothetical protein